MNKFKLYHEKAERTIILLNIESTLHNGKLCCGWQLSVSQWLCEARQYLNLSNEGEMEFGGLFRLQLYRMKSTFVQVWVKQLCSFNLSNYVLMGYLHI